MVSINQQSTSTVDPLKIAYVTAAYLPSKWANSVQVVKMAQAFQQLGHAIDLITTCGLRQWVSGNRKKVWQHYGITTPFSLTQLPVRLLMDVEKRLNCGPLSYGHIVARWKKHQNIDLVYARNYVAPYWSARLGIPTIAESHAKVDDFYRKQLLYEASKWPSFKALVTNSPELINEYAAAGVPRHKIIAEQNGVDISTFDSTRDFEIQQKRDELLASHKALAVYAGHLYDYKGIPDILDAAGQLPDVSFALVGGWEEDVARVVKATVLKRGLKNVTLTGFVDNRELPAYLKAADLLLLPNSANLAESKITSPLKLFEYMASETPIVASNIQTVTHILRDSHNAILVAPDDSTALVEGIRRVMKMPSEARSIGTQARMDVQHHAWPERIKRILEFAGV